MPTEEALRHIASGVILAKVRWNRGRASVRISPIRFLGLPDRIDATTINRELRYKGCLWKEPRYEQSG